MKLASIAEVQPILCKGNAFWLMGQKEAKVFLFKKGAYFDLNHLKITYRNINE